MVIFPHLTHSIFLHFLLHIPYTDVRFHTYLYDFSHTHQRQFVLNTPLALANIILDEYLTAYMKNVIKTIILYTD